MVFVTIIFGRFFCGWVCPFGAIHQFVGYLGNRGKTTPEKIRLNTYRTMHKISCADIFSFCGGVSIDWGKSADGPARPHPAGNAQLSTCAASHF
jgi:polyferredoxin